MINRTKIFIESLHEFDSHEEIILEISKEHQVVKNNLQVKGFEILEGWYGIKGGQNFIGEEDVELAFYYEDLNAMIEGVTNGWVVNISKPERFLDIKESLNLILETKK